MLPPLVRPEDPGVDQTLLGTHQAYHKEEFLAIAEPPDPCVDSAELDYHQIVQLLIQC